MEDLVSKLNAIFMVSLLSVVLNIVILSILYYLKNKNDNDNIDSYS